jgi:glycosyltransferase involved in cell wall biosynthesis
MNVLHLISSGGYYGAENVVVSLAESLEAQGCRSVIGVFHNEHQQNVELIRQTERRGLTVQKIPCRGRWDWQTVRSIREALEMLNIDVLHTHGYKPNIYGYVASRKLGLPLISTCHLWTRETAAVRVYDFLDSVFLRRFDAVVAVSHPIADSLRCSGIPETKIHIIDNGIDLMAFSSVHATLTEKINNSNRLVVGTVGRLVPQKGVEYFLRAARDVLLEFPDVIFVVIGAGPDREKLEMMAKDLTIEQNVRFTGHCADMPGAYASLDVFVLASVDEGMPMAVLEALASKRAVVATSVGAVPRLIAPGKTGLLVPPKDIQALKLAILELLNNSCLRNELGNAGENFVQQCHSRQAMGDKYLELYQQVTGRLTEGARRGRRSQADLSEVR